MAEGEKVAPMSNSHHPKGTHSPMPNSQFAVETVLLPDFSFSAEAASVGADAAQKGRGSLSGGMGGAEIGSGITMHDIEELVSNAEAAALEAEGSEQAKGSGSSQEFHRLLHEGVLKWRRGLLQPARVADVGGLVNEVLKLCEMFHCRPEPMADRSKLFPICAPGSLIGSGSRTVFRGSFGKPQPFVWGRRHRTRWPDLLSGCKKAGSSSA